MIQDKIVLNEFFVILFWFGIWEFLIIIRDSKYIKNKKSFKIGMYISCILSYIIWHSCCGIKI